MLRNLFLFAFVLGLLILAFRSNEMLESEINQEVPSGVKLQDPELAPPEIRDMVMKGYKILLETRERLPDYAGDVLSCANCHFSAGNTFGGFNGGISLVGVTKHYPQERPGGKPFTLEDRINGCFLRSMNGKPLPKDSSEMQAMIAYLDWISKPAEIVEKAEWLGLPKLKSEHVPNPRNGEALYKVYCWDCHGERGQGQPRKFDLGYPPLWGDDSFNQAAGMNDIGRFSSFIYHNMPYQEAPFLTIEEALDIAAYVTDRPRPELRSSN